MIKTEEIMSETNTAPLFDVYGIGNALVDTEYTVEEAFLSQNGVEKSLMTLIEKDRRHELEAALSQHHGRRACGGSAANTVIATAQLGLKSFYSCKIANDETGDFYEQDLLRCGVESNCHHHSREEGDTGTCLVLITPDAERSMNTFLGITTNFSESELMPDALKQSRWLYIEGYLCASESATQAAVKARESAEAAGVKTALTLSDQNMVSFFRENLVSMIGEKVDMLFSNEAEALLMAETNSLDEACDALKQYAHQFAITLGESGALIFDGEQLHKVSAPKVTAIDCNGAGDMFAGAYLYAICRGFSAKSAGQFASQCASEVVKHYGPRLEAEQLQALETAHLS